MSPEVWVAVVSTLGLVLVALISNRSRQHAKAARVQVENSHDTNMREEGDDRHAENRAVLNHLVFNLDGIMSDIRGIRRDIGRLADADMQHDSRIRDIEQTHPPKGTIE